MLLRFTRKICEVIFISYLHIRKEVELGKNVRFDRIPNIGLVKGTKLKIGRNVTINSNNSSYHVNMHSKCKFLLDKVGAEIEIGDNTRIHGSCLHAYSKIKIGKNCLIAANCQIIDCNGHSLSFPDVENRINTRGISKPVTIEDNVWLGMNVVVLPGIRIGYGSIISANSVVNKDIPPMVIAGGNPIVILKKYE